MQRLSTSDVTHTWQTVLHGMGMLFMFALLAVDQTPLLVHIYDWLQVAKRALLSLS